MNAINEQDGLMVSGFLFQFPIGFHKGPLLLRVELVWHAGRLMKWTVRWAKLSCFLRVKVPS